MAENNAFKRVPKVQNEEVGYKLSRRNLWDAKPEEEELEVVKHPKSLANLMPKINKD